MALEDLLHSTKTSNHKGLNQTIYAIKKSDITAFPALTTSPTTEAEKITRTGTFTLVATKFFKKIQITAGSGKLVPKAAGSGPRQMSNTTELEFKRAIVDAEAYGWLAANQNEELVFVVPNRNGVQVIMGDPEQGCYLSEGMIDQGGVAADEAGLTVKFAHDGPAPTIWAGTAPLA
jgi:hypothetical protein